MLFHHICILTLNYEVSKEFYIRILGSQIIKENRDFHGREYNSWFTLGNIKLELQTPRSNDTTLLVKENNGLTHIAFMVDDIEEAYRRFVDRGAKNFIMKDEKAIYEVFGEKLFKMVAPEGTIIEFRDCDIK